MSGDFVPAVIFINPWERRIGPNRYLVEMLRHSPALARKATVVFAEHDDAREEYEQLGCNVPVWEETAQIRARLNLTNLIDLAGRHTIGLKQLIKRLAPARPDLVVTNTEQVLLGNLAARWLNIPHLKIFHAASFSYRLQHRQAATRAYLRSLTIHCNRIIAVSETLKKELVSHGLQAERVIALPNPIAAKELAAICKEPLPGPLAARLEGRGPVLVNVGRISPMKGQDRLIDALPFIKEAYPRVLCVFAGQLGSPNGLENPYQFMASLQKSIRDQNLEKNVAFVGEIDCLPSLFRQADLYVHTSHTESFCRAVAEALACGTPAAVFDVGALPEVAGPGAVYVRPGDNRGLADAVIGLLSRPEKRDYLAEAGLRHVAKFFDARQIAAHFAEVLTSTASR